MQNEKAAQRDRVIYEFAVLFQPFEDLAKADTPPSPHDYRIAVAKVYAGDNEWRNTVKRFGTFAPDVEFSGEIQAISHVPERFRGIVREHISDRSLQSNLGLLHAEFKKELSAARKRLFELLDQIPFSWEPVIFQANTPFTAYLRIKECLTIINDRMHYFDRYLKPDFFSLFLSTAPRDVEIRLVTTAGNASFGVAGVSAVSNLASQEFSDYQLLQIDASFLHDRNFRVDDQMFSLGPGVDRAGMALTNFGPSDSTPTGRAAFDHLISVATVMHHS